METEQRENQNGNYGEEGKEVSVLEENSDHPERDLANQVSIMDFVRQKGYVVVSESSNTAKIEDVQTDGLITVNKKSNTWFIQEPDGKWVNGRTIRFASRMDEMEPIAALDYLVENRAQYVSSQQYNEQYNREHQNLQDKNKEQKAKQNTDPKPNKAVEKQQIKKEPPKEPVAGKWPAEAEEEVQMPVKKHYSKEQLGEIIAGTKHGLDIKVYDKLELAPGQMKELRIGLENDINLNKFAFAQVPAAYM